MSALADLAKGLTSGSIEVIDLTATLSNDTPILLLPPEMGQTWKFELDLISKFDERGPGWYWNNFKTGEHTGTHFDAPNHWYTGDPAADVASVPVQRLVAPVVVMDFSDRVADNPDFLLEVADLQAWIEANGEIEAGSWLIYRTGWDANTHSQDTALNADEAGPHTPGVTVECAKWIADNLPILGFGVETIGTDAGQAFAFESPFPCHAEMARVGKYGLTQLQNVAKLPQRGAVICVSPLPILTGSGSPARVLALVER